MGEAGDPLEPATAATARPGPESPFPGIDGLPNRFAADADDPRRTRNRLAQLLWATRAVSQSDDLDGLLRRIVEVARSLLGARYAAFGVLESGRLTRFVHAGMPDDTAARLGAPPVGAGVLGLAATTARPIRLTDLRLHPEAVGYPPGHPPMASFLAVPIRVRDRPFGALYLADEIDGPSPDPSRERGTGFTAEDEHLARALAAAAGVAIENVGLIEQARRDTAAAAAVTQLATRLLAGHDVDRALQELLDAATDLTGSHGALIAVPDPDDPARIRVTHAARGLDGWAGCRAARAGSLFEMVNTGGEPTMRIPDIQADPRRLSPTVHRPSVAGPVVATRFRRTHGDDGIMVLARLRGGAAYQPWDAALVEALGQQAGMALLDAEARQEREQLARLNEREQLTMEVNETTLRELTALAVRLTSLATHQQTTRGRKRVLEEVDRLDALLAGLRDVLTDPAPPRAS